MSVDPPDRAAAALRSGKPFWPENGPRPQPVTELVGPIEAEVVVVGGGVTGALVALHLVQSGVDVVLIDRGEFAAGSTAASTGLLQYEIDTLLVDLIGKVGESAAVHAYRRGLKAVAELGQLVAELPRPCGFSQRNALYLASRPWHRRRLEAEYECRRSHGFDVDLWSYSDLATRSSLRASGALHSTGDAQIDPYHFTLGVLEHAEAAGLRRFGNTPALKIEEGDEQVWIETLRGCIRAKRIVYATGYEAGRDLDTQPGDLNSTYAICSEPREEWPGWPEGCLIWETARPYFYARFTDDGRAIIGGGDTAFSTDHRRDGLVEGKVKQLEKRFARLFPECDFVTEFAWAGTFAETKDGLAYIGQTPGRPTAYFALGYGGNGITFSMIAARLISDLYLGRPNPDAEVFRFGR